MYDHIYLTGFKKFGLHAINPTQQIANAISSLGLQGVTCSVVEVTTIDVDKYIQQTLKHLSQRKGEKILHLHLGVGPNMVYKLQTHCYNNKNFSIPDNIGYKPTNQKITNELELDCPLLTKLNVNAILQSAKKKGFASELSTNPGRYLCNYIYFRSLFDISQKIQGNHSFFIHFPTYTFSSHDKNVAYVTHLIGELLKTKQKENNHTVSVKVNEKELNNNVKEEINHNVQRENDKQNNLAAEVKEQENKLRVDEKEDSGLTINNYKKQENGVNANEKKKENENHLSANV